MPRHTNIIVIAIFFILVLFSLGFCEESITIATYYPSPYGSYNQLQTNSLGVGDNDNDDGLDSGDVPTTAGDVWIKGRVGIGTTSPSPSYVKLHVAGSTLIDSHVLITDDLGNAVFVASGVPPNGVSFVFRTTPILDNYIASGPFANYTDRLVIRSNGNVGIGKANPEAQLDLSTDSARKLTTTTWTTGSDIRLKKDIRPFTDGLNVISRINPVWFKWNGKAGHKDDGKDNIGVIGQEIEKVAPYTVTRIKAKLQPTDKNETELIDFTSHALIFALINSVKEMDTKITKLEKENADLRQRINALEKIKKPGPSPK